MSDALSALYPSATPSSAPAPAAPAAAVQAVSAPKPAAAQPAVLATTDGKSTTADPGKPAEEQPPPEAANAQQAEVDASLPLDVRWGEPPAASVVDFANVMRAPSDFDKVWNLDQAEFTLAQQAMVKAGVGITQAQSFFNLFVEVARARPQISNDDALEQLREHWGDKTEERVESARAVYREMLKTWPGITRFLEETRLGSHPKFIRMLAEKAIRQKAK